MTKKYGRILSTKSSKNISRCSVSLLLFNNRILGVCIPSFTVLVLELLCSFSAITNCFCFLRLLWQTATNWVVYNNKKWLSHSSGGQKCQIKMLAGLCSRGKAFLVFSKFCQLCVFLGLRLHNSSLHLSSYGLLLFVFSYFDCYKDTCPWI